MTKVVSWNNYLKTWPCDTLYYKRYYLLEAAISTIYKYSMLRNIEDIIKNLMLKYV